MKPTVIYNYKKLIKALYCLNQIRPKNKFIIKVADNSVFPQLRLKEEYNYWVLYIDKCRVISNGQCSLNNFASKIANFLNRK